MKFKYIRSALTPSLPLLFILPFPIVLLVVLEISRQRQMCSTKRRDLFHSPLHPFPLWWEWLTSELTGNLGWGSHTPCFSLNTVSGFITLEGWKWRGSETMICRCEARCGFHHLFPLFRIPPYKGRGVPNPIPCLACLSGLAPHSQKDFMHTVHTSTSLVWDFFYTSLGSS